MIISHSLTREIGRRQVNNPWKEEQISWFYFFYFSASKRATVHFLLILMSLFFVQIACVCKSVSIKRKLEMPLGTHIMSRSRMHSIIFYNLYPMLRLRAVSVFHAKCQGKFSLAWILMSRSLTFGSHTGWWTHNYEEFGISTNIVLPSAPSKWR